MSYAPRRLELPHNSRRARVRPVLPHMSRNVRVGEVYMTAAQVRAELDRVAARWNALHHDIVANVPTDDPFRAEFDAASANWRTFYNDAYADWLAWGSNVTQAESFDAELDSWRTRYAELTGREPTAPVTSTTGRRHRGSGSEWASAAKWVAGAVIVGAVVYAVTR